MGVAFGPILDEESHVLDLPRVLCTQFAHSGKCNLSKDDVETCPIFTNSLIANIVCACGLDSSVGTAGQQTAPNRVQVTRERRQHAQL